MFGPSLTIVIAVISFFSWAAISRIVRGQALSIKEREYIEAARSLGAGPWRIMFIDILPNLMAPVLVLATLSIPAAIVFESTLVLPGPRHPAARRLAGATSSPGRSPTTRSPGGTWSSRPLALLITTLAFNLLGDGVRDAIDPRTERIFAAEAASGAGESWPAACAARATG